MICGAYHPVSIKFNLIQQIIKIIKLNTIQMYEKYKNSTYN